jgi:hypothetical protein
LKKIGVTRKSTKEKSRRPVFHLLKKPIKNTAPHIISRTGARVALQKGIKDNGGFPKIGRTIRTEITCVTKVRGMHIWQ